MKSAIFVLMAVMSVEGMNPMSFGSSKSFCTGDNCKEQTSVFGQSF